MGKKMGQQIVVPNGPVLPVSLGHQCRCQGADMPYRHTLGDHEPGDPRRPW